MQNLSGCSSQVGGELCTWLRGSPLAARCKPLRSAPPLLPLALASGQAGKILQQDPSWVCSLPFHSNSPSGGRSQQRKMLPPPSLASPAGRYFDCIPGELGCRCGLLILGSSESVFPCAVEQAAEVCREEEIAPEACQGELLLGTGTSPSRTRGAPVARHICRRPGRCPCSVNSMQP